VLLHPTRRDESCLQLELVFVCHADCPLGCCAIRPPVVPGRQGPLVDRAGRPGRTSRVTPHTQRHVARTWGREKRVATKKPPDREALPGGQPMLVTVFR